MLKIRGLFRKPLALLASIALLALTGLGAKKFFDYSAAPTVGKACDFSYPADQDVAAPNTVSIGDAVQPGLKFEQIGGSMNDASCLNRTPIYEIVHVATVEDISRALQFARGRKLKVTVAGQHHSMGGQSFSRNGLVLDMRPFNGMTLDGGHKVLRVQSGATWQQVQQFLDARGLSVKAMQSINIFTVGGTLSVNAHGIAHDPGLVALTVRSMRIMLADGHVVTASLAENPDLFRHVLGGYGLFGVILDADLDVVDNAVYALSTRYIDYRDFPRYYREHVEGRDGVGLFYGRLSIAPGSYLAETAVHVYTKADPVGPIPPLQPESHIWLARFVFNFSKTGGFGRALRWALEKHLESHEHDCISRNQAMNQKEECLVSRNQEMYDPMQYLRNRLQDTDILQEYFLPHDKMPAFVDGLRNIVGADGANLLNVTIRAVRKDRVTAMPYARQDAFAFVLYFNQKLNTEDSEILQKTTSDLIDLATRLGGAFYLPYQLYYSREQLLKAYPGADEFFAAKKRYDPVSLFENKFYQKYAE